MNQKLYFNSCAISQCFFICGLDHIPLGIGVSDPEHFSSGLAVPTCSYSLFAFNGQDKARRSCPYCLDVVEFGVRCCIGGIADQDHVVAVLGNT
jgi:hypothetical protein